MRNLPKEVRLKFTSDIGFVADFLNEGNFESRTKQKIVHIEALCKMMETLTGDSRFTNKIDKLLKMQEGGREVMMCEYIDMLEAKGEARGEDRLTSLLTQLYELGREEDVKLALKDKDARKRLYQEFCPAKA